jgi:hypothetical protein
MDYVIVRNIRKRAYRINMVFGANHNESEVLKESGAMWSQIDCNIEQNTFRTANDFLLLEWFDLEM